MPLTINGTVHNDGDPLLIGGVQAQEVTVNGVTVWENIVFNALWIDGSSMVDNTPGTGTSRIGFEVSGNELVCVGAQGQVGAVIVDGAGQFSGTSEGNTAPYAFLKAEGIGAGIAFSLGLEGGVITDSVVVPFDPATGFGVGPRTAYEIIAEVTLDVLATIWAEGFTLQFEWHGFGAPPAGIGGITTIT